jgi:hypothetical protein
MHGSFSQALQSINGHTGIHLPRTLSEECTQFKKVLLNSCLQHDSIAQVFSKESETYGLAAGPTEIKKI